MFQIFNEYRTDAKAENDVVATGKLMNSEELPAYNYEFSISELIFSDSILCWCKLSSSMSVKIEFLRMYEVCK